MVMFNMKLLLFALLYLQACRGFQLIPVQTNPIYRGTAFKRIDHYALPQKSSSPHGIIVGQAGSLSISDMVTLTFAAAVKLLSDYKSTKEGAEELHQDAHIFVNGVSPDDIRYSSVAPGRAQELEDENEYVHRPELEKQITSIINRKKADDHYFILYGSKGCGKSILAEKCIVGKKGVVSVMIGSVFDESTILQKISTEIKGKNAPAVREEELVAALKEAKVDGRLATVVFEIECVEGARQFDCINRVRSLSKMFAQVCNCIIILSEENTILVFGQDDFRESYILVPDLSIDEALQYMQARKGTDVYAILCASPTVLHSNLS